MTFQCRDGCGACCIAPSITGPIPDMPAGKKAGVACVHLDQQQRCKLFGLAKRPLFCAQFQAEPSVCGDSREQAMRLLTALEWATH